MQASLRQLSCIAVALGIALQQHVVAAEVRGNSVSSKVDGGWERGDWSMQGGVLRKSASRSAMPVAIPVSALDVGTVLSAGGNPFDGGAWVAGTRRVVWLARDGRTRQALQPMSAAKSARFAADESIWLRSGESLNQILPSGANGLSVALPSNSIGALDDWEIDAARGVAWLATESHVLRVDLYSREVSRIAVPTSTLSIAYDHARGHVWALLRDRVMAVDFGGKVQFSRRVADLRLSAPDRMAFSTRLGTPVVRDQGSTKAIIGEREGSIEVSKSWAPEERDPIVLPSVRLGVGSANVAPGTSIAIDLSARCGRSECDLGPEWISSYRIEARLGSHRLENAMVDAASRTATLRVPKEVAFGKQALVVQAIDGFGHRSAPVSRWIRFSEDSTAKVIQPRIVPAVSKAAPAYCVASPSVDLSGTFAAFSSLERLEVRSGRLGAADWEWGLGANTQQAGKFVSANLNWINGRAYQFILAYDGLGNGTIRVFDGSAQVFLQTFSGTATDLLRTGNAIRLYAKSSAGIGPGNRIALAVTEVNGLPLALSFGTAGSGDFSEVSSVIALNSMQGFEVRGTVTMEFAGSYPPTGSRLNLTVNAGTVQCLTANQPPTVFFASPGEGNEFYPPAVVGVEVYAEDPEGALANIRLTGSGPEGFVTDFGSVSQGTYVWEGLLQGTYALTATATDVAGASTTQSVTIRVVSDPIDQSILEAWNGLLAALSAGNQTAALDYFTAAGRERFGRVFADLQGDAASALTAASLPIRVLLGEETAEYLVMRGSGEAKQVFFVYWMKGDDGLWRIEDM